MPAAYKIDPEIGLIFYLVTGPGTVLEVMQVEERSRHDPARRTDMGILVDLTEADISLSLDDMKSILGMNRKRIAEEGVLMTTAVIGRSKFMKVMADTLRMLGDSLPLKLEVFTVLPDAVGWLGKMEHMEKILALRGEMLKEFQG